MNATTYTSVRANDATAPLLRSPANAARLLPAIGQLSGLPANTTFRQPLRDVGVNGAVNRDTAAVLHYIVNNPGQQTQTIADAMATLRRTLQRSLKKHPLRKRP